MYGEIRVLNFGVNDGNPDYKKMIYKCIQHIMNENLLFLKDLLEP